MARQKPGPKGKPKDQVTKTTSVSLTPPDWDFLATIALEERMARAAATRDGNEQLRIMRERASASSAIRRLIDQERLSREWYRQRGKMRTTYHKQPDGSIKVLRVGTTKRSRKR